MALGGVCHEYLKKDTIMRDVYSPSQGGAVSNVIKIEQGGHGKNTAKDAREALQVYGTEDIGAPNGLIPLKNGVIPTGLLNPALVSSDGLYGPTTVGVDSKVLYKINNFDSFKDYSLKAQRGHAVLTEEGVVYSSPSEPCMDIISFQGNIYNVEVLEERSFLNIESYNIQENGEYWDLTFQVTLHGAIPQSSYRLSIYTEGTLTHTSMSSVTGTPSFRILRGDISTYGSLAVLDVIKDSIVTTSDKIDVIRPNLRIKNGWIQRIQTIPKNKQPRTTPGSVSFARNGKFLAYNSIGLSGWVREPGSVTVSVRNDEGIYVPKTVFGITSRSSYYGAMSISPDGEKIALGDCDSPTMESSSVGHLDIYKLDSEGNATLYRSFGPFPQNIIDPSKADSSVSLVNPNNVINWNVTGTNLFAGANSAHAGSLELGNPIFWTYDYSESNITANISYTSMYGVNRKYSEWRSGLAYSPCPITPLIQNAGKYNIASSEDGSLFVIISPGRKFSGENPTFENGKSYGEILYMCKNSSGIFTNIYSVSAYPGNNVYPGNWIFGIGTAVIGTRQYMLGVFPQSLTEPFINHGNIGPGIIAKTELICYSYTSPSTIGLSNSIVATQGYNIHTLTNGIIPNNSRLTLFKINHAKKCLYIFAFDPETKHAYVVRCQLDDVGLPKDWDVLLDVSYNKTESGSIPEPEGRVNYFPSVDINEDDRLIAIAVLGTFYIDIFKY